MQSNNKILGLEVIRFASAIAILIYHYQHFSFIADKPIEFIKEQQPFYPILSLFYNYGNYGVPVFWCISGFIFYWKYGMTISEKIVSGKKFFILRFSRLYPLHIATLLLVALLQLLYFSHNGYYFVYQYNDYTHFFLQLFLASDWGFQKGWSFNAPIWSISVEVLIYFTFFITLRCVGKSTAAIIGILSLCAIAMLLKLSSPLVDCLRLFYLGGLSAVALQHFENTTYQRLLRTLTLLTAILVPFIVYVFQLYKFKYFPYLFSTTYTPVILYSAAQIINSNLRMRRVIEVAGNMTYSSYLIHFPVQLAAASYYSFANKPIPFYSSSFFVAFLAIVLLASYLIYRSFEMPAQAIIRKRLL